MSVRFRLALLLSGCPVLPFDVPPCFSSFSASKGFQAAFFQRDFCQIFDLQKPQMRPSVTHSHATHRKMVLRARSSSARKTPDCCKPVFLGIPSSSRVCTKAMAKSKGTKRGRKKKRVAAHIKDASEKRAASAFSGNSGEDQKAQLLASPLGVGRPKRPREPGQSRSVSCIAMGRMYLSVNWFWLGCRVACCGPLLTFIPLCRRKCKERFVFIL